MDDNKIHNNTKQKLSEYLDGHLAAPNRVQIEKHLAECRDCAQELARLQTLVAWMKETPPAVPPSSFYEQVMRRVKEGPVPKSGKTFKFSALPLRWVATASVGALVIFLVTDRHYKNLKVGTVPAAAPAASVVGKGDKTSDGFAEQKPQKIAAQKNLESNLRTESSRERDEFSAPQLAFAPSKPSEKSPARRLNEAETGDFKKDGRADALVPGVAGGKLQSSKDLLKQNTGEDKERLYSVEESQAQSQPQPLNVLSRNGALAQAPRSKAKGARFENAPVASLGDESRADDAPEPAEKRRMTSQVFNEWRGTSSQIRSPMTAVVFNQDEWSDLWKRHKGARGRPPPISFDRQIVIAVFAGNKPTGGYSVRITDVAVFDDRLEVHYAEQSPAPGLMSTQAETQPYDIQVIPWTKLPIKFIPKTR